MSLALFPETDGASIQALTITGTVSAGEDSGLAYAAALAGAAQLLANEARTAGTYTVKEPFNFAVAALFPSVQVAGGAPQVPTGLLTHQIARF